MTSKTSSKKNKFKNVFQETKYSDYLYPHIDDPKFNIKIAEKKEFNETQYDGKIEHSISIEERAEKMCNAEFELAPHQLFVRNFLSFNTPYNSLLLYHGLGTGKTCSAITIAEEMRQYLNQLKISQRIIIVASPNVQDNFKSQLFNEAKLELENGYWKMNTCVGYKLLKEINPTQMKNIDKKKIVSQIKRIINTSYLFLGYREFNSWVSKKINPENASSMTDSQIENYQKEQIKKLFNNRLIIVDEVHNIRITDESLDNKKVAQTLIKLAEQSFNMRLLLLSATPMFNNYKEIIWLINLMNSNDKRPTLDIKDVFDKKGNFVLDKDGNETGKTNLIKKMTGYVSFVRGENPFTFPYRIFPKIFESEKSILNSTYPSKALNGKKIIQPLEKLDIYCSEIGSFQQEAYYYIIENLKKSSSSNIKKSFENMDTFGYNELQYPIESLNMSYPLDNFTRKSKGVAVHELVGKAGLRRLMKFDETNNGNVIGNFEYETETLEKFGRIFSLSEIGKYSGKINNIINNIKETNGIILIYSQYIDGGIIPMTLALEELGFTRYGDTKSLFKTPPTTTNSNKYIIISGEKNLSPNNLSELNAVTDKKNSDGNIVKVVLISRAGSEGLDFKNIRDVHIIDPWYNTNRLEQTIGRAIRWKSHCNLPFNKRNARIFIYGTLLNNDDEAVDMYVHRVAELKAMQIGNVSRIMKESAVDCILNSEQINFTENNMNKTIKLELANGKKIDYAIGDKPYSAVCDYLESCSYTCKPNIDDLFKLKLSTYDESFVSYNSDKIIQKIKDLFTEKYFYTKNNLINSINIEKSYPIEHINYAIESMIDDKNITVSDCYNKPGNLIKINDYIIFQPLGFKNKNISIFDRTRPVDYKRDTLLIKLNNKISEESQGTISDKPSTSKHLDIKNIISELEKNYNLYISILSVKRGSNDTSAFVSNVYHNMLADSNFDSNIIENILIDYLIDYLSFDEKILLLNHLFFNDTVSPFELQLKKYFERKIIHFSKNDMTPMEGLIITNNDKNSILYINNINNWQEAGFTDKEAFTTHSTKLYQENFKKLNILIGYVEINKSANIFKTLDISEKRNKGRRCVSDGKAAVIKQLNKIVGFEKFNKKNVKTMTAPHLCIFLEFIMRYFNYEEKNGKIWFIESDMIKFIEGLFKLKK